MIKITDKTKCSGCHACSNICPKGCIEMKTDAEGFWYPYVNEDNCINCNLCEKVCPVINENHNDIKTNTDTYAAFNNNEEIRMKSSSGGVFTLIAENVIKQNGVVFGACFDDNFNVVHDYAETIDDLEKFRGSKYVQSKIGDTYKRAKEFLDNGRLVLFTGTPCQIGGIYAYLRKEYENLITQDIICHGVPSPKVWNKYVNFREKMACDEVKFISFRNKDNGWKNYNILFEFSRENKYIQIANKDMWSKVFLGHVSLRPSCFDCNFKNINRQSDITLADFWGIQNVMPEMDDDKGTSLLIINSDKGKNIFKEIEHQISYKKADLQVAIKHNPSMIKSVGYNTKRDDFLRDIDTMSFDKCVKKYCESTFMGKCIRFPRSVASKVKRAIFK
ncbi:MAG: Coenzyme F420 hydrogenase/dehydrogenase, beta subunit C-terminal domain [Clostridia bacterium]